MESRQDKKAKKGVKMNKLIFILFVFILLLSFGCIHKMDNQDKTESQKDYEKCTSICSVILDEDFVTMKLCVDECKKEFLEGNE